MNILLFLQIARSQFVPFLMKEYDERFSLPVVNKTELEELVNKSIKVVAMGFSRRNPRYKAMLQAYSDFAMHYSSEAIFVIYDHHHAKNEAEKLGMRIPIVFYYENATLITPYPYMDNEVGFTRIFELIFHHDDSPVALTKNELFKLIGDMSFSILAPTPELYQNALKLHRNLSMNLAEIDVVRVSPDVLVELKMNPDQLVLYRNEDSCMSSFKTMHEDFADDIYSFYNISSPVYKIYQGADLINEKIQMFVLTAHELTDEMKDFLYEIGPKYPQYNFGWLKPEYIPIGELVLNSAFQNRTDMHFCNFARRWYIDIEDVFTWEFVKQPFNKMEWTKVTERAIKVIEKGRKKIYVSESIPKPIKRSLIKKVVGLTYCDFINDPNHDVLMMYVTENCEQCKQFKPAFIDFVKEFDATGKKFLKFGWINIERNSANDPFPYIPGFPHFEFFPAKNKSAHEKLRGSRSRDQLVRFLKNRCMEEFPLTAPPPDKMQTAVSLVTMLMNIPARMPNEEIPKLMAYLAETAESIGIDVNSIPGFEAYANKLSPVAEEAQETAKMKIAERANRLQKEAEKIKATLENGKSKNGAESNENSHNSQNTQKIPKKHVYKNEDLTKSEL